MKIRTQISLVSTGILVVAVIVAVSFAVDSIRRQTLLEMAQYREEEFAKARTKLKNLVDIAYTTMDTNYRNARDKAFLEQYYGSRLRSIIDVSESVLIKFQKKVESGELTVAEAQRQAAEILRVMRFDNGTGYTGVIDTGRPIPSMIMHPVLPQLEGLVIDAPEYYCALGRGENLAVAIRDVAEAKGEGFVDYEWPKPIAQGVTERLPKLSFVRLFKPWGWVLVTGVYVDDALRDAVEKTRSDLRKMRYDGGTGYFWINDTGKPYPTMIMHPTMPELEGRVLDASEYNCALGQDKNLFVAFREVSEAEGGGYVDYLWPKPVGGKLTAPVPKLSYVRIFEPLGWIIGTGVYTDGIDTAIQVRIARMQEQINHLIFRIVFFSIIVLLGSLLVSFVSANSIIAPLRRLTGAMRRMRTDEFSIQRPEKPSGADEVRELGEMFNEVVQKIETDTFALQTQIRERKRMEQALHETREMLRLVLDSIPIRVFWKGSQSVYLGCNLAFARDAGFADPEEILSKSDHDLPWQAQADSIRAADTRVMTANKPEDGVTEARVCAGGRIMQVTVHRVPLRDPDGRAIGVLGTYTAPTFIEPGETG